MKKCATFLWVGVVLFSFSTAYASNLRGKLALTGSGGLALPIGDFGEESGLVIEEKGFAKSGFALCGTAEFFVTDNISFGGNFGYQQHGMKTKDLAEDFARELESELAWEGLPDASVSADASGDHKIVSFGLFGKLLASAGPELSPYVRCGFGIAKLKTSLDISGDVYYQYEHLDYEASMEIDADAKPYLSLGGGMLYQVSETVALTGEVVFTHVMTDGADADAEADVEVRYMGVYVAGGRETGKTELDYNVDHITAYVGLTILLGGTR